MTQQTETKAFYERDGEVFRPTGYTRGPWDSRFQHGGPPAALLAGRLARHGEGLARWQVARVLTELYRPVPLAPLRIEVRVEGGGRSAQRLWAGLHDADGALLVASRTLRLARAPLAEATTHQAPPWPDPEATPPFAFDFFRHPISYGAAVELRLAHGVWGTTPIGFWARTVVPLVAGEEPLPLERLLILADAQSGMGVPVDLMRYTFVNPDMCAYLDRDPEGDWFGFDIRSSAGPDGVGLAQSAVRDMRGELARTAQSLLVRPR
ncbi:MAG: hypothetical protein CSA66_04865 [Proteobacteria bacterium]|nr:MAG: hypothetical protein CSA66_04865 [Pseudomonadota bacterium]